MEGRERKTDHRARQEGKDCGQDGKRKEGNEGERGVIRRLTIEQGREWGEDGKRKGKREKEWKVGRETKQTAMKGRGGEMGSST